MGRLSALLASGPGKSLLARSITLPVSAVAGLLTARLVLEHGGLATYAFYSLLATLPALIPVTDMGVAAAVTNLPGLGSERGGSPRARATVLTSLRTLCLTASLTAGLAVVLGLLGAWPRLLGQELAQVDLTAATALALFGVSIVGGIGGALLRGAGRYHVVVLVQGLVSLLGLLLVALVVGLELPAAAYPLAPYLALALGGLLLVLLGHRRTGLPSRRSWADVPRRQVPGASIRRTAGPMVVVLIALPIAYNSDRLVLSHVAGPVVLATYSLAAQIFSQVSSLVGAAGLSLWSVFAQARNAGTPFSASRYLKVTALFGAGGLALALALVVVGDPLCRYVSDGQIVPGTGMFAALGSVVLLQAVSFPAGMYLTDEAGLRFQARNAVAMVVANVVLSVLLARALGAVGPVLATVLSMALIMVVPNLVRAHRQIAAEEAEAGRLDAAGVG